MMKSVVFICLAIWLGCSVSCTRNSLNESSIIAEKLTNNSEKFWDVHKFFDREFMHSPVYCFSFNVKGTYERFYYEQNTGKRRIYDPMPDVLVPNTWEIRFDTLTIGNSEFIMKVLTPDTLILVSMNGDQVAMHSSK